MPVRYAASPAVRSGGRAPHREEQLDEEEFENAKRGSVSRSTSNESEYAMREGQPHDVDEPAVAWTHTGLHCKRRRSTICNRLLARAHTHRLLTRVQRSARSRPLEEPEAPKGPPVLDLVRGGGPLSWATELCRQQRRRTHADSTVGASSRKQSRGRRGNVSIRDTDAYVSIQVGETSDHHSCTSRQW